MIFLTWLYLTFTSLFTRLLPPLVVKYLPKNPRLKALSELLPLIALCLLLIHMLIPAFTRTCDFSAQWVQNTSVITGLSACLISSHKGAPIIISIFIAITIKVATASFLMRIAV